MRGFKSGFAMLHELCLNPGIVAIQEHWLREDDCDKLNLVNNNYNYRAVSGMNKAAASNILAGRPFGGVGFLWHKSFNSMIQYIAHDADGRCIIIKLVYNNCSFMLINVYFPCYSDCPIYRAEIASLSGFIENTLLCNTFDNVIILGDTNFDVDVNNAGYNILKSLLSDMDVSACDDLVQGTLYDTYFNEALGSSSRIDHFFVSNSLKHNVHEVGVLDSNCNYSDH